MSISYSQQQEPCRQLAVYSQQESLRGTVRLGMGTPWGHGHPSALSTGVLAPQCPQHEGLEQDLERGLQCWGAGGVPAAVLSPLQLCQALEDARTPSLQLQPLPSPWPCLAAYAQGNSLATRKIVLPILRAALAGQGAAGGPEEEVVPPPTPMNSLVEECPLAQAVPPLCPQEVLERVSRIAAGQPPGTPE